MGLVELVVEDSFVFLSASLSFFSSSFYFFCSSFFLASSILALSAFSFFIFLKRDPNFSANLSEGSVGFSQYKADTFLYVSSIVLISVSISAICWSIAATEGSIFSLIQSYGADV